MKLALADTSGPLRRVVEPLLLELMTPESCCHDGIAMPSGEDAAAAIHPRGLRFPWAARAGGGQVRAAHGHNVGIVGRPRLIPRRPRRMSPDAAKKFCPCAAIF